ncbi:MAG: Rpn family recombination-promoting nuclease/putative transposase [Lachnospiraceae bacterium]|nr:Rpn family recombination-promoting nuclease/putative transposase [Lachnospiraceae bacterium]
MKKTKFSPELQKATGPIPYNMTADYLFRIVLQENKEALQGLLRALLHLEESDSIETLIKNPIVVGKSIVDKEYRMDVLVIVNGTRRINLEMQNENQGNWPDRSLLYLCRSYDKLLRGDNYSESMSALHIGFLDFPLFPNHREFYGTYRMCNVKDGFHYNDKFSLSVIELNWIDIATEEDKRYKIDQWARLFKAKTWEDLKMIAQNNSAMAATANSIFQYDADEAILKQIEDREDALREALRTKKRMDDLERENAEQKDTIAEQKDTITRQNEEIARLQAALAAKQ